MTASEQVINHKNVPKTMLQQRPEARTSVNTALAHEKNHHSVIPGSKFITHHPKAGLNPLVDAAAYLFTALGKLKQLNSYRQLSKLQQELIHEINHFEEAAKARGYSSEYILVSRYALCATLDDVITNTPWGGQGQWDSYSLLAVFNQEAATHERFFIILDRIIKKPEQYIDVMELMYLCLSLGYKGSYRATEYGNSQLEQITHALYRSIRAYKGDFSRTLAPHPIKATPVTLPEKKQARVGLVILSTVAIIMMIFLGLGYLLDMISNQSYQELLQIGHSLLYDTTHT